MKTKVLLLGAALAMTTAIASAQTYSSNVVGYVNVDLVPGWNLIANPLDAGVDGEGNDMNSLSVLFPNSIYDNGYVSSTYSEVTIPGLGTVESWSSDFTVYPGEGVFVNIPEAATVTFVGEVVVGNHSVDIPAGWSIISNPIPVGGAVSALGLDSVVEIGDSISIYDNGYVSSTYSEVTIPGLGTVESWSNDFEIAVGQAFFINKANPSTWTKTFEF